MAGCRPPGLIFITVGFPSAHALGNVISRLRRCCVGSPKHYAGNKIPSYSAALRRHKCCHSFAQLRAAVPRGYLGVEYWRRSGATSVRYEPSHLLQRSGARSLSCEPSHLSRSAADLHPYVENRPSSTPLSVIEAAQTHRSAERRVLNFLINQSTLKMRAAMQIKMSIMRR
jgi:hypothetical protein